MAPVKLLDIEPPDQLAELLGYQGRARWIQIYWEQVCGSVCVDKSRKHYVGSQLAWELFAQKFPLDLGFLYLFNPMNCLLLDRHSSILYGGDRELISQLLDEPNSLKLLETAGIQKKRNYATKINELMDLFSRGASFAAGAIAVTLVAGGAVGIGIKLWSSYSDSTDCQQLLIKVIDSYPKQSEVPPPK